MTRGTLLFVIAQGIAAVVALVAWLSGCAIGEPGALTQLDPDQHVLAFPEAGAAPVSAALSSTGGGSSASAAALRESVGDALVFSRPDTSPGSCPCAAPRSCYQGLCRMTCQPGDCNAASPSCVTGESCVPTTDGGGLCMPAVAPGAPCSGTIFCQPGNLCLIVDPGPGTPMCYPTCAGSCQGTCAAVPKTSCSACI